MMTTRRLRPVSLVLFLLLSACAGDQSAARSADGDRANAAEAAGARSADGDRANAAEAATALPWDETTEAGRLLMAGLAEAAETDRMVFLHSGAPWCGWCKRLEAWLVREDIEPIFSKDFVVVRIDVEEEEMEGGEALMHAYNEGYGGVPWLAILAPDGSVVITSDDPERGNIGSPRAEWEIEHWNVMMRTAARRITEEEILYMAGTWAKDRPEGG